VFQAAGFATGFFHEKGSSFRENFRIED